MKDVPPPQQPEEPAGPSGPVFIIVIVALVVGGWFLTAKLRANAKMEDCLMSGRTNCAPVAEPGR